MLALLTRHKTCHLHTQHRQGVYTQEFPSCVFQDMSGGSCHVMVISDRYSAQTGCHTCRICSTVSVWEQCDQTLRCIFKEQCMAHPTTAQDCRKIAYMQELKTMTGRPVLHNYHACCSCHADLFCFQLLHRIRQGPPAEQVQVML